MAEVYLGTHLTLDRAVAVKVMHNYVETDPDLKSRFEREAKVGSFVETKKTHLKQGAKANHLAYLGDTEVGERVNVGAGVIVCNYDGFQKQRTVIGEGTFVGSDSQLIAPVTVGKGAYVAAGSSITQPVPPGALAVGRGRQVNKEGWVEKKNKK